MLKLSTTAKFKKDLKICAKRKYNLDLLYTIVDTLRIPMQLPAKNKDHILDGNFSGYRECHITPDWLLIYKITDDELLLDRTGTHSDLFRK